MWGGCMLTKRCGARQSFLSQTLKSLMGLTVNAPLSPSMRSHIQGAKTVSNDSEKEICISLATANTIQQGCCSQVSRSSPCESRYQSQIESNSKPLRPQPSSIWWLREETEVTVVLCAMGLEWLFLSSEHFATTSPWPYNLDAMLSLSKQ